MSLTAASVLALGLGACGDDDGETAGNGAGQPAATTAGGGSTTGGESAAESGGGADDPAAESGGESSGDSSGGGEDSAEPATTVPAAFGAGDQKKIRKSVTALYAALRKGNAKGVCATLTPTALERVGDDCREAMADVIRQGNTKGGPVTSVGSATRKGRIATVTVSFGKRSTGLVELAKDGSAWKVGEFTVPSATS